MTALRLSGSLIVNSHQTPDFLVLLQTGQFTALDAAELADQKTGSFLLLGHGFSNEPSGFRTAQFDGENIISGTAFSGTGFRSLTLNANIDTSGLISDLKDGDLSGLSGVVAFNKAAGLASYAVVTVDGTDTDTLFGIEKIIGSVHDDTLTGDAYNNIFDGGAGDDTLTGGGGADKFVLTKTGGGSDTVTDFADGTDKIQIASAGDDTLGADGLNLGVRDNGGNTEIYDLTTTTIVYMTLDGVTHGDIDITDFEII